MTMSCPAEPWAASCGGRTGPGIRPGPRRRSTFRCARRVGTGDCSGSGTPVRSEIRPASSRRPRLTSQAGDSGILKNASGNSVTNGSAPIQNRPRQPIESSSRMPRSAASRLPNGTPA